MNITLSKKSQQILNRHLKDMNEMCDNKKQLTDKLVQSLINQMIASNNEDGNVFEEYLSNRF